MHSSTTTFKHKDILIELSLHTPTDNEMRHRANSRRRTANDAVTISITGCPKNPGACSSLPFPLPACKCHWLFGQPSVPAYFQEASHRWMTEASMQQDSDYITVFHLPGGGGTAALSRNLS